MIGRPPHVLISSLVSGALAVIAGCAPAPAAGPVAGGPDEPAPRLTIKQRDGDPKRLIVESTGLDGAAVRALEASGPPGDGWRSFLIVRVVREKADRGDDTPALLGTYRRDGDWLRFEPRFPIEPGLRYRAEYDPRGRLAAKDSGSDSLRPTRMTAEISIGRSSGPPTTTVTAIYPTRAVLPENLLRFYIHFSSPMSRGEAYRHIRLLDGDGRPIADPFLEIDEELWSGDGRRFTLLFDPGRIKRGLRPREEVGPVLMAGRSYVLIIDPGWTDAAGRPLKAGFRKVFRAGPADETSPDPKTWAVRPPAPGTRDPLVVRFPEPLDRALLDRLIAVRDGSDRLVAGSVSVSGEETVWRFTPETPWPAGAYRLVVGTDLEDVVGNSVARPFEVDEVGPITRRIAGATTALPFRIVADSR